MFAKCLDFQSRTLKLNSLRRNWNGLLSLTLEVFVMTQNSLSVQKGHCSVFMAPPFQCPHIPVARNLEISVFLGSVKSSKYTNNSIVALQPNASCAFLLGRNRASVHSLLLIFFVHFKSALMSNHYQSNLSAQRTFIRTQDFMPDVRRLNMGHIC